MAVAVPDILARIVDRKRIELRNLTASQRVDWEKRASARSDFRDFQRALIAEPPAIISEIKKASPSKGVLAPDFDPASIARIYEEGGAAALSVLTDRDFFQGSLDDLIAARAAVELPVLRKDFTIDAVQMIEAAANGADAILLIAALLDEGEMRRFRELAESLGMAALVEVHDAAELDAALASGAKIVGVNNRDLRTFEVKIEISLRLAEKIPSSVVKVAESGIHSSADVRTLRAAGFDAFLVGERLMKSPDPAQALRELRS
ncbi:MAG TPA: indole-3-glycerol phosphate synthase TrpC [Bryobacteraceae bacterium]|nr:indole-3-glycerol phosphate synthase TrpC [Bryobacteraceae bacterium]